MKHQDEPTEISDEALEDVTGGGAFEDLGKAADDAVKSFENASKAILRLFF